MHALMGNGVLLLLLPHFAGAAEYKQLTTWLKFTLKVGPARSDQQPPARIEPWEPAE